MRFAWPIRTVTDRLFDIQLTKNAAKDLRKFRQWLSVIEEALGTLAMDPYSGEPLQGSLRGVHTLHLRLKGSGQARIAYVIYPAERVCLLIALGMRENFYDLVTRRIEPVDT